MLRLLYVSSARALFSKLELSALLERSRANNESAQITGILLYKDGNFMQVLEGDEPAVTALYHRIGRDPRHFGAKILLREQVTERLFPDWSMGFRDLSDPEIHALPGYNEFMNVSLNASLPLPRCFKLLAVFRTRM
jgi:hypothetical protein